MECNFLKNATNDLIYKRETDLHMWKTNLLLPKGMHGVGKGRVRINQELGINIHNLTIYKKVNQQRPTV